ncbi:hypothetical protein CMO91_04590 [Candidatus Woesearchaeota archaeon]|jgi:AbrB family looped-hinge helix DNA binding protein|nr:hypothetical protein [Candidatus Woesearchaeota archaeon]|tara:strand:+ start:1420 stop:1656 length:237 start_codon:yes stop_codon:yes gene_type:complete
MIVTVSKGQQITIPAVFRKALNLRPGSRVELEKKANKLVIRPAGDDLETLFKEAGQVRAKKMTPKEMEAYAEEAIFGH